jgi:hypothetical protein
MNLAQISQTLSIKAPQKKRGNLDQVPFWQEDVNYTVFHFQSQKRISIACPLKYFKADLLLLGFIRICHSLICQFKVYQNCQFTKKHAHAGGWDSFTSGKAAGKGIKIIK